MGKLLSSFLLIFSFTFNGFAGLETPRTEKREESSPQIVPTQLTFLQNKMNSFLAAMGRAQEVNGDSVVPTISTEEANLFGLRGQSIIVPTKNSTEIFQLGNSLLPIPAPTVSDVLLQTKMYIKEGELLIQHNSQQIIQRITGFNFIDFVHDGQFLFLLNKGGRVFAVNNRYIKKILFQAPLPIFEVGRLAVSESLSDAKINVVTEEKGPLKLSEDLAARVKPIDENQQLAFTKGDLFISVAGETVDVLNRGDVFDNYMASAKYLTLLTYQNNPRFFETESEIRKILDQDSEVLEKMQVLIEDPKLQEALKSDSSFSILSSLPPYVFEELLPYLHQIHNQLKNGSQRKRILFEQFLNDIEKVRKNKIQSSTNFKTKKTLPSKLQRLARQLKIDFEGASKKALDVVDRTLTKENISRVAMTLGVLSGAVGIDSITGGHIAAWSISFASQFWHTWFAPWSTPGIGGSTLKAVGTLMLAPYLYQVTGYLGGLITGQNYKEVLNKISFKTYAAMNSYIQLLSMFFNQKNLLPSARRGINPFNNLKSMNAPWVNADHLAENRRAIESSESENLRLDNAAWLLAHAIILDLDEIDPVAAATAEIELSQNRMNAEGLLEKKYLQSASKSQMKEVSTLALGIKQAIVDLGQKDFISGLKKVSPDKLAAIIFRAYELRDEMKLNSNFSNTVKRIGLKTKLFWQKKLPRGFGVFASESFLELLYAEPNEALMRQNLRVFKNAFTGELLLSSVIGDYSDTSKPDKLLANPNGPLGVNPSFFAQQLQSVLYLVFANPARMFLDFSLVRDPSAQKPTPDQLVHPRTEREGGFFETAKEYVKNVTNLPKLNMGYYAIRHLQKTWLMVMSGLTMAVFVRYGVLNQSVDQAVVGELYRMISSYLVYGWLWGLETRSLTLLEHEVEARAEILRDAQYRINQGLIENNGEMIREGLDRLEKVYNDAGKSLNLPQDWSTKSSEQIRLLAQDFLVKDLNRSVIPYKPNELFMRMITVATVVFGSEVSSKFFSMAYASNQTLTEMLAILGHGVTTAGIAYSTIWGIQTMINKTSEYLNDRKTIKKEEENKREKINRCVHMLK